MEHDQREKITIEVAKIIWKNEISISDFFEAIEGQQDVIYGMMTAWDNPTEAAD